MESQPLIPETKPAFALALQAEGLPSDDLDDPGRLFFRFLQGDDTIGYGGLEGHGPDRLLRSVVVLPGHRGRGLGADIIGILEAASLLDGSARLHLLTHGAAKFFRAQGYVEADRTSAPPAIAESRQFASLCPATATYLIKVLP